MRSTRAPIVVGKRTAVSGPFETGPRVQIPSPLCWKANGLDLLVNLRTFDKKRFAVLVEEFRSTAAGRQDIHVVMHLRTLARNPRLRWPVELYSSLLRWTMTPEHKNAALRAEAIWSFLFGRPLPRWYKLDQRTDSYKLDIRGWKTWYDSLPHQSPKSE
jgi:hypothetical protein